MRMLIEMNRRNGWNSDGKQDVQNFRFCVDQYHERYLTDVVAESFSIVFRHIYLF
jgi:hypothetical protein